MNPAEKAWATRRARAAAAAGIAVKPAEPVAKAQVMTQIMARLDHPVVDLFIEEEAFGRIVGYGRRRFVVVDADAQWVRLFSAAQLVDLRVPRITFDRYAKPATGSAPKAIAAIIKRNLADQVRRNPDESVMVTHRAERGLKALQVRT